MRLIAQKVKSYFWKRFRKYPNYWSSPNGFYQAIIFHASGLFTKEFFGACCHKNMTVS